MKNFIDFDQLGRLSISDLEVGLSDKLHKLTEESGELSQAYLGLKKSNNVSKSGLSETPELLVLEEACDVTNVILDIINYLVLTGMVTSEDVKIMFHQKLDKWESKIQNYKD